jgi:hypothetical protein
MSYLDEARARAKRRKSLWNLLLIPAVVGPWFLLSWLSWIGLGMLHRLLHPGAQFVILPDGISGILMAIGPLFAWLVPAMVIGNLLVASIGPARRALDAEAKTVPRTDLASSNRALLKMSLVLTPPALLVSFLGAFTAW